MATALFATGVQAEPLTYAQTLRLAENTAPSVEASLLQVEAATKAERAAGQLPDPKMSLGIENLPITGSDAGRFGAERMTMARIGVMQEVPNGARRRAAAATAIAETQMATADAQLQSRTARIAAALAWIDLAYSERQIAALDQLSARLEKLWEGQRSSVASGAARPAAGLEHLRLKAGFADRRSALVADAASSRAKLARWTGMPDPSTGGDIPMPEIAPAALHANIDDHPALALRAAEMLRAESAVAGARAAKRPDWSFDGAYGRRDPMFGDMVSAGVTFSLPFFAHSRQDPLIAARNADVQRARLLAEDMRRDLIASLDGDLAAFRMREEQWRRATGILVPAAEQTAELEIASFAAGRAGVADLGNAFTAVTDTRLDAIAREAMMVREGTRILLTYGSDPQ